MWLEECDFEFMVGNKHSNFSSFETPPGEIGDSEIKITLDSWAKRKVNLILLGKIRRIKSNKTPGFADNSFLKRGLEVITHWECKAKFGNFLVKKNTSLKRVKFL